MSIAIRHIDDVMEISIVIPSSKAIPPDLLNDLKRQTFKDFEIVVGKNNGSISKGLNYGIRHAKGRKIIFLESDVRVLATTWLSQMNKLIDKYEMVKADQVILSEPAPESYNNTGIMASIAKENLFDEHYAYKASQDVEWFQKLRANGYVSKKVRSPIIYHFKKLNAKKAITWSFYEGMAYSRIALSYKNPDMNFKRILLSRGFNIGTQVIVALGELYGFIVFFPQILRRKKARR